jgi:hypothetical protein
MTDQTAAPAPAAALAIDERFAKLAADFMAQVDVKLEAVRQEFLTQFGQNVDPLHKDLHDLLDMQTQAGAKIEKLEAADFVTPEGLQKQLEGLADAVAQKIAPKAAPVVQPMIGVTDQSLEDRVRRLEGKLKHF